MSKPLRYTLCSIVVIGAISVIVSLVVLSSIRRDILIKKINLEKHRTTLKFMSLRHKYVQK